jgi:hypothetical protein
MRSHEHHIGYLVAAAVDRDWGGSCLGSVSTAVVVALHLCGVG